MKKGPIAKGTIPLRFLERLGYITHHFSFSAMKSSITSNKLINMAAGKNLLMERHPANGSIVQENAIKSNIKIRDSFIIQPPFT
ncbi:hypothetical protein [Rossellomorea vietnamensis]|uniref:hypothetical protein n=1 Tax=Rossellomorea vietnamensis TaxID=218284 RepID=UPI0016536C44|nr:hypothetical protein [Rossellomorea vietnamensis]